MKKLEKIDQDVLQKKRALLKAFIPLLEELLHFITKAKGVVGLY